MLPVWLYIVGAGYATELGRGFKMCGDWRKMEVSVLRTCHVAPHVMARTDMGSMSLALFHSSVRPQDVPQDAKMKSVGLAEALIKYSRYVQQT